MNMDFLEKMRLCKRYLPLQIWRLFSGIYVEVSGGCTVWFRMGIFPQSRLMWFFSKAHGFNFLATNDEAVQVAKKRQGECGSQVANLLFYAFLTSNTSPAKILRLYPQ